MLRGPFHSLNCALYQSSFADPEAFQKLKRGREDLATSLETLQQSCLEFSQVAEDLG